MLFWSRIVDRRRALKHLARVVSEALAAREGAIADRLLRADRTGADQRLRDFTREWTEPERQDVERLIADSAIGGD